jgi:tyrosyl-tRNA synthetase
LLTVIEQLSVIQSGGAEIVPLAALSEKLAAGRPLTVKLGVDPTAPDLHLGHAVPLRKLRQLQELGHRVVLIIGDATALVGDPSGRNSTRPPLSPKQIATNAQTYVSQAFKILDANHTQLCYNSEWLSPLNLEQILRLTGQFTVARVLEREDFHQRYKSGQAISLHEFLYPVMQAYDSVMIKADIEIGGTDQLFNLLAGRELMEKLELEPQVCLTLPLLVGTDGTLKMSKSYGNYIGIDEPPQEMFGKLMSISDELMPSYFNLASGFSAAESADFIARLHAGTLHPNAAKRLLAKDIVATYWGTSAAADAEAAFDRVFKLHELPADIPEHQLDWQAEGQAEGDGIFYVPQLLARLNFAASSSEARRLVDNGGVRINGRPLARGEYRVTETDLRDAVLSVGKRKFVRLR